MAKTEDEKMYSLVCEKRFDIIDQKQEQVLNLLRGSNSTPGIIEELRVLKSRWKMISIGILMIMAAFVGQVAKWIFTNGP